AVAKLYLNNTTLSVPTEVRQEIKLYPNPVQDIINIASLSEYSIKSYKIYTTSGVLIKEVTADLNLNKIDVGFLNPGVYILSLIDNDATVSKYKIIKK